MKRNNLGKQIISASRRTDIPAFYSKWFFNRLKAGFCYVPNPLYPKQKVKPIGLKPEDVKIIVFWTRNAKPLLKYLPNIDKMGYKYYFQYTINGYPKEIDPFVPNESSAINTFKRLSNQIGKEKVIWRYDPILFSTITDIHWHKNNFSKLLDELVNYTERIVISFIDPYRKTKIRMGGAEECFSLYTDSFDAEKYEEFAGWLAKKAKEKNLKVFTCAEIIDLSKYGIKHGKCIDGELISRITGESDSFKKDPTQRKACDCVVSKDIGINETCIFGCKYCYAVSNLKKARENYKKHNPESESLIEIPEDIKLREKYNTKNSANNSLF